MNVMILLIYNKLSTLIFKQKNIKTGPVGGGFQAREICAHVSCFKLCRVIPKIENLN